MLFLISLALANPFTVIINNQHYYEYAPIRYDVSARALILNDISCQWGGIFRDGFEDKSLLSVYFTLNNEFFLSRGSITFRLDTKTININLEKDLECNQVTVFRDSYE